MFISILPLSVSGQQKYICKLEDDNHGFDFCVIAPWYNVSVNVDQAWVTLSSPRYCSVFRTPCLLSHAIFLFSVFPPNMSTSLFCRNDIFVFLLSTRAGGLGINLTAADTVSIESTVY